jgi:hypothetical protein
MSGISIATIDSPEFINLQPLDINPGLSACEIKVLYVGQNRNKSFITKEVATEMAKTLRGAPIVGWYREDKQDFADHGNRVICDADGIKFECMTKPYGFVAPDAEVWFQNFEDTDDFGNKVIREYLMTTGYLWTGQYEEAKLAVEGDGRPHSMELDNDSLDGKWSQDLKTGMDFFIINDAVFSKLCILGEDVEPCFEGSSVTKPEVSKTFTKVNDDFKNTLFSMMQDLKFALQGGQNMADVNIQATVEENTQAVTPAEEFSATQDKVEQNVNNENQNFTEGSSTEDVAVNTDANSSTEFKKEEDNKEEDKNDTSESGEDEKDDEDKEKDKKYALLEEKFTALEQKYTAMEKDYQTLLQFKNKVDDEKKDALINSFYMLSDADKKDVIDNKSKYSLEDIEAKLSVICFRKKVSFEDNQDVEQKNETVDSVTTYSLNSTAENDVPAWVQACRSVQNKNK